MEFIKLSKESSPSYTLNGISFYKLSDNVEIIPTSAQFFTFDGDKVKTYTGTDVDVVIPRSYSLEASGTETRTLSSYYELRDYLYATNNYNFTLSSDYTSATIIITSQEDYSNRDYEIYQYFNMYAPVYLTAASTKVVDGNDYEVKYLGVSALSDYTNDYVKSLTLLDNIIGIEAFACGNLKGLEKVKMSKNLTQLSNRAMFNYCDNLTKIEIDKENSVYKSAGNCVIEISTGKLIFGCKGSVIPTDGSVLSLADYCFQQRSTLQSIVIPDSVTSIGEYAFNGCSGLENVTIGKGVTSIANYAFYGCSSLKKINIPESVTSIGSVMFSGCSNIEEYSVDANNTVYNSRDNSKAIIETATNKFLYGCKNSIIPSGILVIGGQAFYNQSGLTSITIPESVTRIQASAFYGTGIAQITIPKNVTEIQNYVFYNCTKLAQMTVLATTPPTLGGTSAIPSNVSTIYIPAGTLSAYQSATNWSKYASKFVELT